MRVARRLAGSCGTLRKFSTGPVASLTHPFGSITFPLAVIVWLHIGATFLMRYVPAGVAHRLVSWFTPLVLWFARGYVERASSNMRQVLGPDGDSREVKRLTQAVFANYARYMVDLVRLPSMDPSELVEGVTVVGWERLEAAFAAGRGVVVATGHVGSWDLAGAFVVARGLPVSVIVETLKPARWNERVQRIREHVGMRAIPMESGVRDMLAVLRRKEALAVLVDRPLAGDGVPVTFFGRTTHVPGGAATLALRAGATLLPAALIRDPDGRGYVAHIGEPISTQAGGRSAADIQELTQRVMSWLEDLIRRHPDQWYMFRQMWPAASEMPRQPRVPLEAVAS